VSVLLQRYNQEKYRLAEKDTRVRSTMTQAKIKVLKIIIKLEILSNSQTNPGTKILFLQSPYIVNSVYPVNSKYSRSFPENLN
jgi:hypothetical protein